MTLIEEVNLKHSMFRMSIDTRKLRWEFDFTLVENYNFSYYFVIK